MGKIAAKHFTEEQFDAISIYAWYMDIEERKYYGKDFIHSLTRTDLYYRCTDNGVEIRVQTGFSPRKESRYFQEGPYGKGHPKTPEEELLDYQAFHVYMTEKSAYFMEIAKHSGELRQILELCHYREAIFHESKYGGIRGRKGDEIDWSVFCPDYSQITVSVEKKTDETCRENGWKILSGLYNDDEVSADLTVPVQEMLGDAVRRAWGSLSYAEPCDYIAAKIYVYNLDLTAKQNIAVGDAEYIESLWIEFANGGRINFSGSEFGSVGFFR